MSANGTTAPGRVSGTLRVLIADDDRVSRQLMRRLGDLRDDLCVVAECGAGLAALEPIARHCPDLVLLEVKRAGEDSSELVRRIGAGMMPLVIVVATVVDFAPSAFEMAAVDYVVKPFANERLTVALDRAVARHAANAALSELERLLALARGRVQRGREEQRARSSRAASAPRSGFRERFLVSIGRRHTVIHAADIAWIRASGYCVTLVTRDRKEFLVRLPLDQLEQELDADRFLRIHRGAIVALEQIQEIERGSGGCTVVLENGARIAVSKTRQHTLFGALGQVA